MIDICLKEGARSIRKRPGLIFLLYGVNLMAAVIVVLPLYGVLVEHIGLTGQGSALIESFDLVLWREVFMEIGPELRVVGLPFAVVAPLYVVWKAAAHVGVIYALHNGRIWPFWRGVGYYTGPSLLVSLAYLPLKLIWVAGVLLVSGILANVWRGAVGGFWIFGVFIPFSVLCGWAILDLFQRYSKLALVVKHDTVWRSLKTGMVWPFKYGTASYLYVCWYAIILVILFFSALLHGQLHVGVQAISIAFLIQQVSLFTRSAASVGWIGSEVYFFERTLEKEWPLIADTDQQEEGRRQKSLA